MINAACAWIVRRVSAVIMPVSMLGSARIHWPWTSSVCLFIAISVAMFNMIPCSNAHEREFFCFNRTHFSSPGVIRRRPRHQRSEVSLVAASAVVSHSNLRSLQRDTSPTCHMRVLLVLRDLRASQPWQHMLHEQCSSSVRPCAW